MTLTSKLTDSITEIKKNWNDVFTLTCHTKDGEGHICYQYTKIIGRGTFGVVIKIQDVINNKTYALKKVYQDEKYHNRELEILKIIYHPNIISLKYYFHENITDKGKYLNLITDYYLYDLETIIKENRDCKIQKWFTQLLSALEYLHSKYICHRDIKPCNILIDENMETAKLCDFGSAKVIEEGSSNISYICSRYYRAPENILDIDTYDTKIDIWSLGCVMAECHLKTPLFKGMSNAEMMRKILRVCKCSKADLLELGIDEYKWYGDAVGVSTYLKVDDKNLMLAYERMLVVNPNKRWSASSLLELLTKKD